MSEKSELAYEFFKSATGTIEIIFQDSLQKIYFMKHPATNFLDPQYKEDL